MKFLKLLICLILAAFFFVRCDSMDKEDVEHSGSLNKTYGYLNNEYTEVKTRWKGAHMVTYDVSYTFSVNGRDYEGEENVRFDPNDKPAGKIVVWYEPSAPSNNWAEEPSASSFYRGCKMDAGERKGMSLKSLKQGDVGGGINV